MVVLSFGRCDVDVVTPSRDISRAFFSAASESSSGVEFRRPCASPLSRISFLLFLVLFVFLHDFSLGSKGLRQRPHLIGHKRVSRGRRNPFCGVCLLPDCFGHLHEGLFANHAPSSQTLRPVLDFSLWVASSVNLTLNALNGERRLKALIIAYRMAATPLRFPSRNRKPGTVTHPRLHQSSGRRGRRADVSSPISIDPAKAAARQCLRLFIRRVKLCIPASPPCELSARRHRLRRCPRKAGAKARGRLRARAWRERRGTAKFSPPFVSIVRVAR